MVGVSVRHNVITLNLASALREHLKGGPCQVFVADIKVRIDAADAFYYPDVVVTCDPADNDEYYLNRPSLIAEVLSPSTEGVDRREKWIAYQPLPTLVEYMLIAQDRTWIDSYRREASGGWWHEAHGPGGHVRLESVKLTLDVDAIY